MDLLTINTLWRPVYGKLQEGIRLLTPEWERLKRLTNMKQLSRRSINWPVQLVNGGGIAMTSDGGSTARATSNEPPEATDTWRHLVGRFEASYDSVDAENNAKFASAQIEKQLRYQAADKLRSFQRSIAIQWYGYPDAIMMLAEGTVSNPSGSVTRVTLNDLYGIAGLLPKNLRSYVTIGKDRVQFHQGTTSTVRANASGVVTAINEAARTIDIASAVYASGITDGDAMVLYNQVRAGSPDDLDLGINGFLHLARASMVHGIDAANYPDWTAAVDVSNYGQTLNGQDLYEWYEELNQTSGHNVNFAYTTTGVVAAGGGPLLDQRRFGADDDTLHLGFRNVNSMGVKLEPRPYTPAGHLCFGSNTALMKLSPDESSPDPKNVVDMGEKAGSFQQYPDTLGFFKDMIIRAQMCVVSRKGIGIASGISEN